jgi:hypothetical protein
VQPSKPFDRAEALIRTVCTVAGSVAFLDEIDAEAHGAGLERAITQGRTAPIFDWLLSTFSFQGISDRVARDYMAKHGKASWAMMEASLKQTPSCPKLRGYWVYDACRFEKISKTCSEPDHIDHCPVPRPRLRNGRLNQTAYSFYLFVRDIAGGDFIGWMDSRLQGLEDLSQADLEAARQEALIGPLRHIYGVSDKVLTMTLSALLIGARRQRPIWLETGKAMIAIDTLVHNFFYRTGIIHDCGKPHPYGAACYAAGGCAEVIRTVAARIDARAFNPKFPSSFARFIQHAIWRFCAADGLNLCNANRVDDRKSCQISYCYLYQKCARKPLKML